MYYIIERENKVIGNLSHWLKQIEIQPQPTIQVVHVTKPIVLKQQFTIQNPTIISVAFIVN